MAKVRSPSYPSISLKEAIEKVTMIYEQNYQSPVQRAVAAELMGYGGLNGKSLGVLAALSKYGLIEGRGDDTRVSDLALSIIAHEPGAPERGTAIQTAASKPELFSEIDNRFAGGKASDAAIRSYLITQKFIPSAADAVVRSYRETKQLAATESVNTESLDNNDVRESQIMHKQNPASPSQQPAAESVASNIQPEEAMDDPYEVAISGNSKTGKKIFGRFSFRDQLSVDELIGILQAMKPQLPKASSNPAPQTSIEHDEETT